MPLKIRNPITMIHSLSNQKSCRFSVNINKIALLRNSRGHHIPDLIEAAKLVIRAGAQGITIHPRPDERHARLSDIRALKNIPEISQGLVELNVEGYPRPELLAAVKEAAVHQFTIVPSDPGELTSTRGWQDRDGEELLRKTVQFLKTFTKTSVFIDVNTAGVELAIRVGAQAVELITQEYSLCSGKERLQQLNQIVAVANDARQKGLRVHLGHDLNAENLPRLVQAVQPDEVSIGHAIVSEAVMAGLPQIIRQYAQIIQQEPQQPQHQPMGKHRDGLIQT